MVGNYGEIIKEALAINNMTQKQLAKKLHLSRRQSTACCREGHPYA